MRLGRLIPLIVFIAAPAVAQESRWVLAAFSSSVIVEYDSQTLSKSGGSVTAWVRYTYTKNPAVSNGVAIHHAIQREYYGCATMTTATYSVVNYTEGGDVISQGTSSSPVYEPVVPGSIGESTLKALCR